MSIFGSDRKSGTMGGLISSLFQSISGGGSTPGSVDGAVRKSSGLNRKLASGALLAAGAAYLYSRSKNKGTAFPNPTINQ
jgi:hypothetical protein